MNRDSTLEAYDTIAPVYEEYSKKRQAYLEAVDEVVIKHLEPNMRLLDIGSGDGRRLAKIKTAAGLREAVALEPSKNMAALCRKNTGCKVYEVGAESLAGLELGAFDAVTALWNVFGHLDGSAQRQKVLHAVSKKLKPQGVFMLDVNNRHNAAAYGKSRVYLRMLLDALWFKESRGDAEYEWKIGDQSFRASGHLFTPAEIEGLLKEAGFVIVNYVAIDYATGAQSKSKLSGQLFYLLKRDA